jgi:hypothetical protein
MFPLAGGSRSRVSRAPIRVTTHTLPFTSLPIWRLSELTLLIQQVFHLEKELLVP